MAWADRQAGKQAWRDRQQHSITEKASAAAYLKTQHICSSLEGRAEGATTRQQAPCCAAALYNSLSPATTPPHLHARTPSTRHATSILPLLFQHILALLLPCWPAPLQQQPLYVFISPLHKQEHIPLEGIVHMQHIK